MILEWPGLDQDLLLRREAINLLLGGRLVEIVPGHSIAKPLDETGAEGQGGTRVNGEHLVNATRPVDDRGLVGARELDEKVAGEKPYGSPFDGRGRGEGGYPLPG